jgi:hypothetical protein
MDKNKNAITAKYKIATIFTNSLIDMFFIKIKIILADNNCQLAYSLCRNTNLATTKNLNEHSPEL